MMMNGGHKGGHPTGGAFIELLATTVKEVVAIRWTKLATLSHELACNPWPQYRDSESSGGNLT
eukprot:812295-Prorocentrum_lima.AAC.1